MFLNFQLNLSINCKYCLPNSYMTVLYIYNIAVQCPTLRPPSHASLVTCSRDVGGVCSMRCAAGYEATSGNKDRTCLTSGRWTGSQLGCSGLYLHVK